MCSFLLNRFAEIIYSKSLEITKSTGIIIQSYDSMKSWQSLNNLVKSAIVSSLYPVVNNPSNLFKKCHNRPWPYSSLNFLSCSSYV